MKRVTSSFIRIGIVVLMSSCATKNAAQTTGAPAPPGASAPAYGQPAGGGPFPGLAAGGISTPAPATAWPVVFNTGTATYTIYEPLCDSWDGHQFVGRSAVAVRSLGQSEETFGVLSFSAVTLVDKGARTATLADIKISGVDFPSAPAQAPKHLVWLRQEFQKRAAKSSLDRLETGLNLPALTSKPEPLNNSPPKIIIATRPAVLVYVDGPPACGPCRAPAWSA